MGTDGSCEKAKLSPCAVGLALGVVKGLCALLLVWGAYYFGIGTAMVEHIGSFYHGVNASFVGGLIGAVYGFIGGYIFGYVFGWFYNKFLSYCCKSSE